MRHSSDRIVTSHAGSLPRPDSLIAANQARQAGGDETRFQEQLHAAVVDVVRRQQQLGIDIPGDGEFGKSMGHRVNYGAWWHYSFQRLGGLDPAGPALYDVPARRSRPGEVVLTSFADRRDRQRFAAAYADPESASPPGRARRTGRSASARSAISARTLSRATSPTSRRGSPRAVSRKAS